MMITIRTFLNVYYVPGIVLGASQILLTQSVRIMPISQMNKWKQKTTKHLVQRHKTSKWHNWDPTPGHLTQAARFFTSMLHAQWLSPTSRWCLGPSRWHYIVTLLIQYYKSLRHWQRKWAICEWGFLVIEMERSSFYGTRRKMNSPTGSLRRMPQPQKTEGVKGEDYESVRWRI